MSQPGAGPFTDPACTCPHEEQSLGRLDGISMGRGIVRLSTTPDCPIHDACQRYTAENRRIISNGAWLYCPIHRTRDCPPRPGRTA